MTDTELDLQALLHTVLQLQTTLLNAQMENTRLQRVPGGALAWLGSDNDHSEHGAGVSSHGKLAT
ncbi:MAG: hypothetical protein JOZ81_08020 [Chloroflexi bacterium]|nr:hypothetical protein [Chloroflexota bacterium]